MNSHKTILHLCADTGSDSKPYVEAGYNVIRIGKDIGVENFTPPPNVYGIIANPPCTHFSIARSKAKLPRDLKEGMRLVQECLRIIWECNYRLDIKSRSMPLKFWSIENPATGFLQWFLGKPAFVYSHVEYGGYMSKKTALWGKFTHPDRPLMFHPLPANHTIGHIENGKHDMETRSLCPVDFAKAFFYANQ